MSRVAILGVVLVGCLLALSGCVAEPLDDGNESDVETDAEPEEVTDNATETTTEESQPENDTETEEANSDANESDESQSETPTENDSQDATASEEDTETATETATETETETESETETPTETETETPTETETETETETPTETETAPEEEGVNTKPPLTVVAIDPETGEPIPDAVIQVGNDKHWANESGVTTFTNIEEGTYDVTVTKTDTAYVQPHATIELDDPPETVEVEAFPIPDPSGCEVTIQVVDGESGEPIEGARIDGDTYAENFLEPTFIQSNTGADGTVTETGFCGEWEISAGAEGYEIPSVTQDIDGGETIVLEATPIEEDGLGTPNESAGLGEDNDSGPWELNESKENASG